MALVWLLSSHGLHLDSHVCVCFCCAGWDPPFALERGTNGLGMESFRFHTRKQLTSALCCRSAPERLPGGAAPAAVAEGRYGGRKLTQQLPREEEVEADDAGVAAAAVAAAVEGDAGADAAAEPPAAEAPGGALTAADVVAALAAANGSDPEAAAAALPQAAPPAAAAPAPRPARAAKPKPTPKPQPKGKTPNKGKGALRSEPEEHDEDGEPLPAEFGFGSIDKKSTLRSFASYADWVKATHFSDPPPKGGGISTAPKKRPKSLPLVHQPPKGALPSSVV